MTPTSPPFDHSRPRAAVVLLAVCLAAAGCVTEETVLSQENLVGEDIVRERRVPQDDDPLPPFMSGAAAQAGDLLRLPNGKLIHLYGLQAPRAGEPFASTSREALQRLVGTRIFRLAYKAGTLWTDPVWEAHVIVQGNSDLTVETQREMGAERFGNSANSLMLGQGYARPSGLDELEFGRMVAPTDPDETSTLEPFTEEQNEAVRAMFRAAYQAALASGNGLYGPERRP